MLLSRLLSMNTPRSQSIPPKVINQKLNTLVLCIAPRFQRFGGLACISFRAFWEVSGKFTAPILPNGRLCRDQLF